MTNIIVRTGTTDKAAECIVCLISLVFVPCWQYTQYNFTPNKPIEGVVVAKMRRSLRGPVNVCQTPNNTTYADSRNTKGHLSHFYAAYQAFYSSKYEGQDQN